MNNSMFLPSLWPYDDNTKVAVALVEGKGTGVFLMNLHIVDLSRMQEILYESPVSYLDSHLESQIDDGIVTLRFPDQTVTLDMRESNPDNLFEQAGYGGIVKYYLEGDTLYADVSIQVSPAIIPGYVTLRYSFVDDQYRINQMDFFLYEDS